MESINGWERERERERKGLSSYDSTRSLIYIDQLLLGAISCLACLLRPRLIGTDLESLRYLLILDRLTPWACWYWYGMYIPGLQRLGLVSIEPASLKARFRKHYYMYARYIMSIVQVVIMMLIRNDP